MKENCAGLKRIIEIMSVFVLICIHGGGKLVFSQDHTSSC